MSQEVDPKPIGQLRLLLPKGWLEELTVLAEFKEVTRLQLIRDIIRRSLDDQMEYYYQEFSKRHRFEETLNQMKCENGQREVNNKKISWE